LNSSLCLEGGDDDSINNSNAQLIKNKKKGV
jgi:hypothetical protein